MSDSIAGKTIAEWVEFARRDDCLERMVPSDLRQLVGEIEKSRKKLQVHQDVSGMLRAQLRQLGHIPCVSENKDVLEAEYGMRAAARGN